MNLIRRRAYGLSLTAAAPAVDFPNATDVAQNLTLADAILLERRWELTFEGHRWFDLVRTGRLVTTMRAKGNKNIQPFHVLFPIPQRERDVNPNLTQNEGY